MPDPHMEEPTGEAGAAAGQAAVSHKGRESAISSNARELQGSYCSASALPFSSKNLFCASL